MTEEEWLAGTDPEAMLGFLRTLDGLTKRKARLFAVALCHRIWPLLIDPRSIRAVHVAEAHADGMASEDELDSAFESSFDVGVELVEKDDPALGPYIYAAYSAEHAAHPDECTEDAAWTAAKAANREHEPEAQAQLLRCFFNPIHPASLNVTWRTPAVTTLARLIYNDRAFADMPVLADALEDAGCDNDDILAHCRADAPHARGCWVLDLILGKE